MMASSFFFRKMGRRKEGKKNNLEGDVLSQ